MKTKSKSIVRFIALALLELLSIINAQHSTAFAQGSLTPPGAPAPTMKSLDQIEARIPISSAPFVITDSGSYYLTTNLNVTGGDAITISNNSVTLDLNGFTISSTAASPNGSGILLAPTCSDIAILNGHIRGGVTNSEPLDPTFGIYSGTGFANGIYCNNSVNPPYSVSSNIRITGVSVSGCLSEGIALYFCYNSVVESCTVYNVGGGGIYAENVFHATVESGNDAIDADNQATDSNGKSGIGYGLYAGTASNCYGGSNSGNGLYASGTAINCYGNSYGAGTGLDTVVANNCYGHSQSGTGLNASRLAVNCDGESHSGTGLIATGTASMCSGSSVSGTAISCAIAIGCTTFGGAVVAPSGKFLGTP